MAAGWPESGRAVGWPGLSVQCPFVSLGHVRLAVCGWFGGGLSPCDCVPGSWWADWAGSRGKKAGRSPGVQGQVRHRGPRSPAGSTTAAGPSLGLGTAWDPGQVGLPCWWPEPPVKSQRSASSGDNLDAEAEADPPIQGPRGVSPPRTSKTVSALIGQADVGQLFAPAIVSPASAPEPGCWLWQSHEAQSQTPGCRGHGGRWALSLG